MPFGTVLNSETTAQQNRKFTSYDRSGRTGLDYAINRTYDSKQGRFTQIDPAGMKSVDMNMPQTLNMYNYCGNDPINHADPLGLGWLSKFFSFLKKVGNFLANLIKIAVFVAVVLVTVATFGVVLGILISAAIIVATHVLGIVAKTIWQSIKESIRQDGLSFGSFFRGLWRGIKQSVLVLKAAFSHFPFTLITFYGYFCAPRYGVDGPTRDFAPIDELDAACKEHDTTLLSLREQLDAGKITKREYKRLKNKANLRLAKRAILSGNSASGGYLLFLEIGVLFLAIFK